MPTEVPNPGREDDKKLAVRESVGKSVGMINAKLFSALRVQSDRDGVIHARISLLCRITE